MISLDPPFGTVAGVPVLRDHADRGLLYVLPDAPTLSVEAARPELSLVQFLGGGSGAEVLAGGVLTLTLRLGVDPQTLERVRAEAAAEVPDRAGADVRVVPAAFDSGSVELTVLGESSGTTPVPEPDPERAGTPAAPALPGPFRIQFRGSGRLGLGTTSRASFQLLLDANAAEVIERGLDQPELPVMVAFTMAFAGLRRSFEVDVKADWSRVYHQLQQRLNANVWYVAADAEVEVRKALEESDVVISTTVLGTGEEDRAAAERTRKQLVDWVLEQMCQPAADPDAVARGVGQVVDQAIWSLTRSLVPGVAYRLRALDETRLRSLDVRARESVAERREVVFQGTLGRALRQLRTRPDGSPDPNWPAVRAGMVSKLDLSGFPRLNVSVDVENRFASDGVRRVEVTLARPGPAGRRDLRTLAFRPGSAPQAYVVNLLQAGPAALERPYESQVAVEFDAASAFGPAERAVTGWRPGTASELVVEPRDAYAMGEVQVGVTPLFPFLAFPAVTVQLRPLPTADRPDPPLSRVRLDQDRPSDVWRFRGPAGGAGQPPYQFRATYHGSPGGARDHVGEWTTATDSWLDLPDPMPEKFELQIITDLPWADLSVAFLQLRYEDPANAIRYPVKVLPLSAQTAFLTEVLPIASGGLRAVDVRLTVKPRNGPLLEGGWQTITDERLVIDRRLLDVAAVRLRVIGGPLADRGLRAARVELERRGPNGQVVLAAERVIADGPEPAAPEPFEFRVGDPPDRRVFARATFVDPAGFATQTPWITTTTELLVCNLRTRTLTAT
jgi:hypothetical protein